MLNKLSYRKENHGTVRIMAAALIMLSALQLIATGQNIDATIGTSGQFMVKSATDTFMTVTQSLKNVYVYHGLAFPSAADNSTDGTIYKGADRFIHTYEAAGTYGQNTFIGLYSGNFSLVGGSSAYASYNTAVGASTLAQLSTGYYNSAFGWRALYNDGAGGNNCAFGMSALYANDNGNSNSAFGRSSMEANVGGTSNAAFGSYSLSDNTSGNQNAAFGANSLAYNVDGLDNAAFGYNALASNVSADCNAAFGWNSLVSNVEGTRNCAFGALALEEDSAGSNNSAFGYFALYNSTSGSNTGIGCLAGSNLTTGSNVTCVGYNAQSLSATSTNEITLGNTSVSALRCNVTTISSLSDARDKKDIRDLNLGIDFLMKVKPRLFNWDRREWYENKKADGSKMEKTPTAGFIAQELDEVQTAEQAEWLKLVLKNNPDRFEATPGNLLPVMVKAIQQLKEENNELKAKLAQYEQVQKLLVNKMEKLESNSNQIKETKMSENK